MPQRDHCQRQAAMIWRPTDDDLECHMSTDIAVHTYTADVSDGIVAEYQTWKSLDGLSMMLVPRDDGTVEILVARNADGRVVYGC